MNTLLTAIIAEAIALFILAGTGAYFYTELQRHADVIDNQGSIIKLIVETPEINALVVRELQKIKSAEK